MEWIGVNDRLPETFDENGYYASRVVLVYDGESIDKAMYQHGEGFDSWAIIFGDDYIEMEKNEITHWMPLPNPPKQ